MISPYADDIVSDLMGYSPWLFLQSPAFSDESFPSGDLCRSQSAPPCLEQGHALFCSPLSLPPLYSDPDVFSLVSSTNDKPPSKEHIPRPPNAFMLYRSNMLKNRGNADPEKRQQNLSRIAGQLWREMSDEDRTVWHEKAAEVHAAHYAKYPHYKFKPNRKGIKSGAKSLKSRGYHQPTQPHNAESSMGPVRRARSRRVYPKGLTREDLLGTLETQFPSSVSSSPGLSPLRLPPLLSVLPSESISINEHPNAILSHYQPQPQRTNALGLELDVSQPPTPGLAEILSDLARDLDAVRFNVRVKFSFLNLNLTSTRLQLLQLSNVRVTYRSPKMPCLKMARSLDWNNSVFPIIRRITYLNLFTIRQTIISRQPNFTHTPSSAELPLIPYSPTSGFPFQCHLTTTMSAMSGAMHRGCLPVIWIGS